MQYWTEENFKNLLSCWGVILQYAPIVDEDGFYQNPCFMLETSSIHKIDSVEKTLIEGSEWEIKIVESKKFELCPDSTFSVRNALDTIGLKGLQSPFSSKEKSAHNHFVGSTCVSSGPECSAFEKIAAPGTDLLNHDQNKVKENMLDQFFSSKCSDPLSSNEFINPLTPPDMGAPVCLVDDQDFKNFWNTRNDLDSVSSEVQTTVSLAKTML